MDNRTMASMIDLSCVQANHDEAEIAAMADAARTYGVFAGFALPAHTGYLKDLIRDTDIKLGGTVGFPSGSVTTETKLDEVAQLKRIGVDELDMVVNITWLRSGRYDRVLDDVRAVVDAAAGLPVKLILEVTYLDEERIRRGCEIGVQAGVEFVKSGTGWSGSPTTLDHIRIMADAVGGRCKLKAAGGVRDRETLLAMHALGVTRFGIGTRTAKGIFSGPQGGSDGY